MLGQAMEARMSVGSRSQNYHATFWAFLNLTSRAEGSNGNGSICTQIRAPYMLVANCIYQLGVSLSHDAIGVGF